MATDLNLTEGLDEKYLILNVYGLKKEYEKDHNPRHVWEAISLLGDNCKKEYPRWIRKYLDNTAKNLLEKCDGKATGNNGVVACLGFARLNQLYQEDMEEHGDILRRMDKLVSEDKMSTSEAAEKLEVERLQYSEQNTNDDEKDSKGRTSKKRGYWGAHKIRKFYGAEVAFNNSEDEKTNEIENEETFEEQLTAKDCEDRIKHIIAGLDKRVLIAQQEEIADQQKEESEKKINPT